MVVVSDLHGGSHYGLLPPKVHIPDPTSWAVKLPEDNVSFPLNSGQKYLWDKWLDFQSRLPKHFDMLIVNGEGINGPSNGRRSLDSFTHHPGLQSLLAYEALKPLRKRATEAYMIEGSEWHTGQWGEAEDGLASALNCSKHPSGRLMDYMLFLDIDGVYVDIAHHISYFMVYRSTPLEREINFALTDEAIQEGSPDLIIRSHTHVWGLVANRHAVAVNTPAWALANRYPGKKSPARGRIGDIGGLLITIDPEAKKKGLRPVWVEEIIYPHPKYKAVRIANATHKAKR